MTGNVHWQKVARQSGESDFTVDDNDGSISYSGRWKAIGSEGFVGDTDDSPSMANGNTVHQTRDPDASATFSFTGTFVSVHGLVIPGCQPPMEFIIDGEIDSTTAEKSFSDECFDGSPSVHMWFSKEDLTPGRHVLTMEMSDFPSESDEYFILDYIKVESESVKTTTSTVASRTSDVSPQAPNPGQISTTFSSQATRDLTTSHQITTTTSRSEASQSSSLSVLTTVTSTQLQGSTNTGSGVSKGSSSATSTAVTTRPLQASEIISGGSSSATPSPSAPQQSLHTTSHPVPIGPIVGAVAGTLILVLAVLFIWYKWRSGTRASTQMIKSVESTSNLPDTFNTTVKSFPSSLQPQRRPNPSSPIEIASNTLQGNAADSNSRLQDLVTRLEREVAEMQARYAQQEGHNTVISGTDTDLRQTQFSLPPPYMTSHEATNDQEIALQQGDGDRSQEVGGWSREEPSTTEIEKYVVETNSHQE
ncbi:hypothetical protein C0995_012401 [Termitomyces sp. Mi166|nr:hypothetical protein C0995_012401 [Termitomyces sp. Mi166\